MADGYLVSLLCKHDQLNHSNQKIAHYADHTLLSESADCFNDFSPVSDSSYCTKNKDFAVLESSEESDHCSPTSSRHSDHSNKNHYPHHHYQNPHSQEHLHNYENCSENYRYVGSSSDESGDNHDGDFGNDHNKSTQQYVTTPHNTSGYGDFVVSHYISKYSQNYDLSQTQMTDLNERKKHLFNSIVSPDYEHYGYRPEILKQQSMFQSSLQSCHNTPKPSDYKMQSDPIYELMHTAFAEKSSHLSEKLQTYLQPDQLDFYLNRSSSTTQDIIYSPLSDTIHPSNYTASSTKSNHLLRAHADSLSVDHALLTQSATNSTEKVQLQSQYLSPSHQQSYSCHICSESTYNECHFSSSEKLYLSQDHIFKQIMQSTSTAKRSTGPFTLHRHQSSNLSKRFCDAQENPHNLLTPRHHSSMNSHSWISSTSKPQSFPIERYSLGRFHFPSPMFTSQGYIPRALAAMTAPIYRRLRNQLPLSSRFGTIPTRTKQDYLHQSDDKSKKKHSATDDFTPYTSRTKSSNLKNCAETSFENLYYSANDDESLRFITFTAIPCLQGALSIRPQKTSSRSKQEKTHKISGPLNAENEEETKASKISRLYDFRKGKCWMHIAGLPRANGQRTPWVFLTNELHTLLNQEIIKNWKAQNATRKHTQELNKKFNSDNVLLSNKTNKDNKNLVEPTCYLFTKHCFQQFESSMSYIHQKLDTNQLQSFQNFAEQMLQQFIHLAESIRRVSRAFTKTVYSSASAAEALKFHNTECFCDNESRHPIKFNTYQNLFQLFHQKATSLPPKATEDVKCENKTPSKLQNISSSPSLADNSLKYSTVFKIKKDYSVNELKNKEKSSDYLTNSTTAGSAPSLTSTSSYLTAGANTDLLEDNISSTIYPPSNNLTSESVLHVSHQILPKNKTDEDDQPEDNAHLDFDYALFNKKCQFLFSKDLSYSRATSSYNTPKPSSEAYHQQDQKTSGVTSQNDQAKQQSKTDFSLKQTPCLAACFMEVLFFVESIMKFFYQRQQQQKKSHTTPNRPTHSAFTPHNASSQDQNKNISNNPQHYQHANHNIEEHSNHIDNTQKTYCPKMNNYCSTKNNASSTNIHVTPNCQGNLNHTQKSSSYPNIQMNSSTHTKEPHFQNDFEFCDIDKRSKVNSTHNDLQHNSVNHHEDSTKAEHPFQPFSDAEDYLSAAYWITITAFWLEKRLHVVAKSTNDPSLIQTFCCCRLFTFEDAHILKKVICSNCYQPSVQTQKSTTLSSAESRQHDTHSLFMPRTSANPSHHYRPSFNLNTRTSPVSNTSVQMEENNNAPQNHQTNSFENEMKNLINMYETVNHVQEQASMTKFLGFQIDTIRRFLIFSFCAWSWIEDQTITSSSIISLIKKIWWSANTHIMIGMAQQNKLQRQKSNIQTSSQFPNDKTLSTVRTRVRQRLWKHHKLLFSNPKLPNHSSEHATDLPLVPKLQPDYYSEYLNLPTCSNSLDFEVQIFHLLKSFDCALNISSENMLNVSNLWKQEIEKGNCCIRYKEQAN